MKYKNYKCKRISKKHFNDIIISNAFRNHPPKQWKFYQKLEDFRYLRKLSPIIIDENNILVDGYCSWIIANDFNYRGRKLKIYKVKGYNVNKKKKEVNDRSCL